MCCSIHDYRSVPGKCPLPGKRPYTEYQGVTVAVSMQTYGIYIPGKRPCGPKSLVILKRPWALTWDTTVLHIEEACNCGSIVSSKAVENSVLIANCS